MPALVPKQITALLRQVGVRSSGALRNLTAIALAESGGEVSAVRKPSGYTTAEDGSRVPNSFYGSRRGLWLIHDSRKFDQRKMVTDAAYAAARAAEISRNGAKLDMWPTWNSGAYKRFLNVATQAEAASAAVSGSILAEDGTYVPAGYYGAAPLQTAAARSAGLTRAEDGSYVPAGFYNNVSPSYAAMRGTAAFTVGGPGQPITASFEQDPPLTGLRVTGSEMTGDIAPLVIGSPEYSASMSEIPNLSFTIADPEGDLLWQKRNLWVAGARVQYMDLDLRIDTIEFSPGTATTGEIKITAMDGIVWKLQRLRGARVDKNVSATGFIWSELKLAGIDPNVHYLGEKTAPQAQIARDVPTEQSAGGDSGEVPSAWTTCVRLAKETGRRIYISGNKVIFGTVAFSRDWAAPGDLRIGWHSSPEGERWLTMPSGAQNSGGSGSGGATVSGKIPLNRARYFRPGVGVVVHNTPGVAAGDRRMVCSSINFTLGRDTDGADIELMDPVDPKPEKR